MSKIRLFVTYCMSQQQCCREKNTHNCINETKSDSRMPMEKHTKENLKTKQDKKIYYFIIYGVVIAVLISLGICGFITVNNRLRALEEQKPKQRCFTTQEEVRGREKRNTKPTSRDDVLRRLVKVEERLNQTYHSVGRQPAFVLRGSSGKPGRDGIQGRDGLRGRDGSPGTNGRDGRDGAKGTKGEQGTRGQGLRGISGEKGDKGSPGVTGVSYIRWGKKSCSNNGAKLVYEGFVGGTPHLNRGSGSNYVCLTKNPVYEKYRDGFQGAARIWGAEYQSYSSGIFPTNLYDHDVPCALCYVETRATQMMVPGTNVCPAGWTREYKGYLMAEHYAHHRTMFTCVDENPDYVQGTHVNRNGALFYFVEGECGSLPCKPYVNGRELTCAVCTR